MAKSSPPLPSNCATFYKNFYLTTYLTFLKQRFGFPVVFAALLGRLFIRVYNGNAVLELLLLVLMPWLQHWVVFSDPAFPVAALSSFPAGCCVAHKLQQLSGKHAAGMCVSCSYGQH